MVKEFYANLANLSQKKREVVVRGKGVLYSEANINRFFGIKDEEDQYEAMLA
jgi:negative regulator of sigma E activity